tara:strand:- start:62 stop:421 length:360 start_codon:yes stop_codon:yes gene_type:complete
MFFKKILFLVIFIFITNNLNAYNGSNQTGQVGFWHTSTVDRVQVGWDERIYVYLDKNHDCLGEGSNLIFYQPTAKGRQMVLSVLLENGGSKEISFRIDSCHRTDGGVIFGYFDKVSIEL